MITNKRVENEKEFICKKCDFMCYYNSDYNRHIATAKHKMIINDNKKTKTNLLNNGLYYNSIFENNASTIQFDANLRYQFSDHLLITNNLKYIQFNSLEQNIKPWGILPLEVNSKITWSPNKNFQLNGNLNYFTGATLYNEFAIPYDLDNALVLNASMSYKLTPRFTAWVKGDNLLDKPYQRWSNYPSLGVQLIAGVVYSFK